MYGWLAKQKNVSIPLGFIVGGGVSLGQGGINY